MRFKKCTLLEGYKTLFFWLRSIISETKPQPRLPRAWNSLDVSPITEADGIASRLSRNDGTEKAPSPKHADKNGSSSNSARTRSGQQTGGVWLSASWPGHPSIEKTDYYYPSYTLALLFTVSRTAMRTIIVNIGGSDSSSIRSGRANFPPP